MTSQAQHIALAEHQGWHHCRPRSVEPHDLIGMKGPLRAWMPVPDYLNDLNAVREVEMTLSELSPGKDAHGNPLPSDRARYRAQLCVVCINEGGPIHATAAQRTKALVIALGLWRDTL